MYASVRAFLDQIIDYAGLFPPAKLPLDEAVQRYLHECKTSPHSRMLRGFVCPTARLQELFALTRERGCPLGVTALGQACAEPAACLAQIEEDLRLIEEYRQSWLALMPPIWPVSGDDDLDNSAAQDEAQRALAGIGTYEVALPQGAAVSSDVERRIQECRLSAYFELPRGGVCSSGAAGIGAKLRTGGLSAEAFPGDAVIASFIASCKRARLRWKATAGLHHPRRHWDAALKVWHQGFLNVFAAGVFAWNHSMTEADLVELLADRELRDLRFEPDRMVWKKWECSTRQIAEARADFATSFGSCSFDEPCDDLSAMGLLKRETAW